MDVPFPADAPVTPDAVTVQSKVAPVGVEVRAMPVDAPEQIVWFAGVAVTTGVGFTVTVAVIGAPTHVPSVGVIV